jgi:hypothetical protein
MLEVKNTWLVSAESGIEIYHVGILTAKLRAVETRGWQMESERIRVARVSIVRTKSDSKELQNTGPVTSKKDVLRVSFLYKPRYLNVPKHPG